MTAGPIVVLTREEVADLVRDAYVAGARDMKKAAAESTQPSVVKRVLTATEVRETYHIGKDTLRHMRESGVLPAQTRPGQGGRQKYLFLAADCERVLGTTHLPFPTAV